MRLVDEIIELMHPGRFVIGIMSLLLTASCSQEEPAAAPSGEPLVIRCTEQPLPEFTLGPQSNPTEKQQAELCGCIWSRLGSWERRTSESISHGKESEVSALNLRAFPARFGKAIEECGGMQL